MQNSMENELRKICNAAYSQVNPVIGNRNIVGRAADGDLYFELDRWAELAILEACKKSSLKVAYFSEGTGKLKILHPNPDYIFISDEIDGSRGAKAGFENCCITMAVAPYSDDPRIENVEYSFIKEIKDGVEYFAEKDRGVKIYVGGKEHKPKLSKITSLDKSSLGIELWTEPLIVSYVTGPIIRTALGTGVFHVNSCSWCNCQIVRGRLDGYFHIAKRVYEEFPEFRKIIAPEGKLKGLFPYDIAPWYLIDIEGGVITTDSFGNSLRNMKLLEITPKNQRCVISASTKELHKQLKDTINERFKQLHRPENLDFLRKSFSL